ncbi:DUF192 domain-containing protein [Marinirhabdus gelatinilytica]|uniref:DUF192 domain-containing protein n=1 Tax=Marinirhabdus gelatinilytica TaxID=1703343 RepID=A0A370QLV2_9FLAO|nr:DUF192 domain-containing protein [Marinirhabdus gelatinilytica]RDK89346.1 hypothetical protein C8D94_1011232 [Marinirhabdus gelatinilytica]
MKKTLYIITLVSGIFMVAEGCKEAARKENKILTKEISFTKEAEGVLKKAETDSILTTLELEIAEGDYETQTGLMYRKGMQPNRGMLFIFPNEQRRSFYMKNTEFGLDIIYLNSKNEVVSIQKNAQPLDPTSLPSEAPATYVLEVNAGLSDTWGLEKGDVLEWERVGG